MAVVRGLVAGVLVATSYAAEPPVPRYREGIEVVATRLDGEVERRVVVLTREDIARLPVRSVADLVAWISGAGVARRGAWGVQADAGLRGATFEQVAVLVNGVRVNDPQTGHFHLDLPYPLEAVERVTVLLGPGSAVHGPDAFGGVIDITVGAPAAAKGHLRLGEYALRKGSAAAPLGGGGWVAASRVTSRGFRPDTEFALSRAAVGWRGAVGGFDLFLDAAAEGKEFGAWAFYSRRFPNEQERTATAVTTLVARRRLKAAWLDLRSNARQHRDVFVLDRQRPDWYRNRHRTRGALLQATLAGGGGVVDWSAGAEVQRDLIVSSRLGSHDRSRSALFAEVGWRGGAWRCALQGRADRLAGLGWEAAPAVTLARRVGAGVTLAYHGGKSFRLPSFTDLYYTSPDTVGDPALAAERAWSDELILRATPGPWQLELAAFRRRARHLIDYLRDDAGIYRATNHAAVTTTGVEAAAVVRHVGPWETVRVSVSRLDSDLQVDPGRSRYAVTHPRLEASVAVSARLPLAVQLDAGVRYRTPQRQGGYAVVDLRLARPLAETVEVALEASNLSNRAYEEVPGVPMPPRWVSLLLTVREPSASRERAAGSGPPPHPASTEPRR